MLRVVQEHLLVSCRLLERVMESVARDHRGESGKMEPYIGISYGVV